MSKLILAPETVSALNAGFAAAFGCAPERYFSAPGRTEIGGNHTDHQRGRVLAGAVNLEAVAAVKVNGTNTIRILSEGYPMCQVSLDQLEPVETEVNTTLALIRGVAARFAQLGCQVEGFDAYVTSTVLPGSGLSSSAAYEVLIGTIINHMFFDGKVSQPEIAMIGQYAENVFFGKPCGLMDQMASAVGGMVTVNGVVLLFCLLHPCFLGKDLLIHLCNQHHQLLLAGFPGLGVHIPGDPLSVGIPGRILALPQMIVDLIQASGSRSASFARFLFCQRHFFGNMVDP